MSDATDPKTPAELAADRYNRALAVVAEYRQAHPGDARTDDDLMRAPYGGYALADMPPERLANKAELLRRLSLGAKAPADAPAPPPPADVAVTADDLKGLAGLKAKMDHIDRPGA